MTCTRTLGAHCMPSVIARYAGRKVISPSLSLGQIQRVSDKKWLFGLPFQAAEQSDTSNGETVADVFADIPPWAALIESANTSATVSPLDVSDCRRIRRYTSLGRLDRICNSPSRSE